MAAEYGCQVITQHSNTIEIQRIFSELGLAGIGYNSDMNSLVGDSGIYISIPCLYFIFIISRMQ